MSQLLNGRKTGKLTFELLTIPKDIFQQIKSNFQVTDEEIKYVVVCKYSWSNLTAHNSYHYIEYEFYNLKFKPVCPKEANFRFLVNSIKENWREKWGLKVLNLKYADQNDKEYCAQISTSQDTTLSIQNIALFLKKLNSTNIGINTPT
jgi:hypothetical protein